MVSFRFSGGVWGGKEGASEGKGPARQAGSLGRSMLALGEAEMDSGGLEAGKEGAGLEELCIAKVGWRRGRRGWAWRRYGIAERAGGAVGRRDGWGPEGGRQ